MQQPLAARWQMRWSWPGNAPQIQAGAKGRSPLCLRAPQGLLQDVKISKRTCAGLAWSCGGQKQAASDTQLTTWIGLQHLGLKEENGDEPAGRFPREVPPAPHYCPNTGKPGEFPTLLKSNLKYLKRLVFY